MLPLLTLIMINPLDHQRHHCDSQRFRTVHIDRCHLRWVTNRCGTAVLLSWGTSAMARCRDKISRVSNTELWDFLRSSAGPAGPSPPAAQLHQHSSVSTAGVSIDYSWCDGKKVRWSMSNDHHNDPKFLFAKSSSRDRGSFQSCVPKFSSNWSRAFFVNFRLFQPALVTDGPGAIPRNCWLRNIFSTRVRNRSELITQWSCW